MTWLVTTLNSTTKVTGQIFHATTGAIAATSPAPSTHLPDRRSPVVWTTGCSAHTAPHNTRWNSASRGAMRNNR
jgi:hypothetical protein